MAELAPRGALRGCPRSWPTRWPRPSQFLLRIRDRTAQQRRHFFLNVNDDLCFTELYRQLAELAAQLFVFLRQWITLGFAAAFTWGQGLPAPGLAFLPPTDQMRGIQTLPAKQCADATWGGGSIFGFLHNAQFVCSGEDATFRRGDNLGIRRQNPLRVGARFGCRCTTLRLTNRAFAPFPRQPNLQEKEQHQENS